MKFARYLDDASVPEWKRAYIDYKGLKKRITAVRREQGSGVRLSSDEDNMDGELPVSDVIPHHAGPSSSEPSKLKLNHGEDPVGSDHLRNRSKTAFPRDNTTAHASRNSILKLSRSSLRRKSTSQIYRSLTGGSSASTRVPKSIEELLSLMTPTQLAFFSMLDRERDKVETFYIAREREAVVLMAELRNQLAVLKEHRETYHRLHPGSARTWALAFLSESRAEAVRRKYFEITGYRLRRMFGYRSDLTATDRKGKSPAHLESQPAKSTPEATGSRTPEAAQREALPKFDPNEYDHARKRLKKALMQQYRTVEILNNYRILNLTGFRKALKKFEKISRIRVQEAYMKEKIESCAFAQGDILRQLLEDMEAHFSTQFARGNRKNAIGQLRGIPTTKTHHASTFRAGLLLGISIPALVDGIVHSFDPHTREEIPGWDALLFIYGIFLVPTLLSLLIGVNLLVWTRTRINYVFIFDLDPRHPGDYREYFQIPAFFIATLSYAFWLSFSRAGGEAVAPQTWPLIWLLLVLASLFNPFPFMSRGGRAWLIGNLIRQVTSGVHRVEFADFWMGDQLTSLAFFLGNIFFVACSYRVGFDSSPMQMCSSPRLWGIPFLLASIPSVVRIAQSIRRWFDSRLYTHLINGGKYGAGVLYYLFYFLWRHNGSARNGSFVLFCLFGAINSAYTCSWDFLMDWSILKAHAQHPLLRDHILYTSFPLVYYVAIVTNFILRFAWIIYLPQSGPASTLRTWIVAMLEITRRWQWNFYRLENEHLGNMDQYRITREIPMYYSRDGAPEPEDEDGDEMMAQ